MTRWWPAPAKLNLFLHITGRRADGYHLLQTAFQFVDYGDALQFDVTVQPDIVLLDTVEGVAAEENLIVRAATLLKSTTGSSKGVQIRLQKKLPMGGGLGGGSSNAATTLVVLNLLWQCDLSVTELADLALQLGADVPVFVHGNAAWAEGVGEQLTPIFPAEPWYLVIDPQCSVPTQEIFSDSELTRDCEPIKIPGFLSGEGSNVCEAVVKQRYPQVAEALDWLAQFTAPRMTGTGCCIYGQFDKLDDAHNVLQKLPDKWQGFTARGCNKSPLLTAMSDFVIQGADCK